MRAKTAIWCSTKASRSRGARLSSTEYMESDGCPLHRAPVLDMIDASDSTRSGCRNAIVWAIMPPIDAPAMCARSIPRQSSSPTPSSAMSASVYAAALASRRSSWPTVGGRCEANLVERPTSRLSNRMTWKPRPASSSQNGARHPSIWVARPMTSSMDGWAGSPNVS